VVEKAIRDFAGRQGVPQRDISDQEMLERLTYPMINEGAKILQEGIAQRASDIDVVWINGYGWPVYRGGPMFYADSLGTGTVVERMGVYAARGDGEDFKPAALLARLASEGGRFQDL
jgi:3-hydroxyacyl-CoA dehydrogenase